MDDTLQYNLLTTVSPVLLDNKSETSYNVTITNTSHVNYQRCQAIQAFYLLKVIVNVPIVGLLCILGFIGNLAVILVLGADGIRNNATLLLRALAMADNAYLISCFIFQTLQAVAYYTNWWPALSAGYPYLGRYVWAFASIALTSEMWMIALMTVERYLTVCTPFGYHRLFTKNRVKTLVLIIPILAVIYNIPRFFEYKLHTYYDPCQERNITDTTHSDFSRNKYYFIIYKTVLFFLFRMIIPMSLVMIFNYKLFQLIRHAKQERAELTKHNKPRVNHTLNTMLVAVVTIYIICQVPDFMLRIITLIAQEYPSRVNIMAIYFTNVISNMLLTFNSSVNCLIYCCCGTKFRKMLFRLCCRCINVEQMRQRSFQFRSTMTTKDIPFPHVPSKTSITQVQGGRSASSYLLNNNHAV